MAPVPRTETYKVPPAYQAKIEEGIKQAATDWGVTLGDEVSYSWKDRSNGAKRTGNRPIKDGTQDTYNNHYKQLWYFFAIVGAYDSMLLLVEPKPSNVPAMEMAYLQAFLRFKRKPKGTPLTYDSGIADGLPILTFSESRCFVRARGTPRPRLNSAHPLFLFSTDRVDT
jgi:hypothetical protein